MKLYSKEHEWITLDGDLATFGITAYAVEQLGDITFVELPDVGSTIAQDEVLCSVDSVKAASDIFMPLSGEVVEINEELDDAPEKVNQSPEQEGWIAKIRISDVTEKSTLMNEDEYKTYTNSLE